MGTLTNSNNTSENFGSAKKHGSQNSQESKSRKSKSLRIINLKERKLKRRNNNLKRKSNLKRKRNKKLKKKFLRKKLILLTNYPNPLSTLKTSRENFVTLKTKKLF